MGDFFLVGDSGYICVLSEQVRNRLHLKILGNLVCFGQNRYAGEVRHCY